MAKLETDPGPSGAVGGITAGQTIAWGIVLVALVAMTDIPALAEVGAGFAILFAVSITLKYGPTAFNNIKSFNTGGSSA